MRYVIDKDGKLKVTFSDCAGCHSRLMSDGSVLLGAATKTFAPGGAGIIVEGFIRDLEARKITINESEYANYGTPWVKDDIHARFKTMNPAEILEVDGFPMSGTFARFNGSPYYITKIPDLNGMKDRRYIDHTGTHLNRGPEDIARYAALVSIADDGSIGPSSSSTISSGSSRFGSPMKRCMRLASSFIRSSRLPVQTSSTMLRGADRKSFEAKAARCVTRLRCTPTTC
jgi:hypothetical protein